MNKFHYIDVMLDSLYGMEMDPDDIEELGLVAWNLIGNKNIQLYRFTDTINPMDLSITLPCNALDNDDCIEAVTATFEDWERASNKYDEGDINSQQVEHYIEARKVFKDPLYVSGKFLPYTKKGDKLYFNKNYGRVNILYRGVILDEEGLPELTDKEATAIATFIAYTLKFKEGLKTSNQNILQQSQLIKNMWERQCDQARVKYLNQNDIDRILNASHSWNRKIFGKSYKI